VTGTDPAAAAPSSVFTVSVKRAMVGSRSAARQTDDQNQGAQQDRTDGKPAARLQQPAPDPPQVQDRVPTIVSAGTAHCSGTLLASPLVCTRSIAPTWRVPISLNAARRDGSTAASVAVTSS
jgi:hypothetical protein